MRGQVLGAGIDSYPLTTSAAPLVPHLSRISSACEFRGALLQEGAHALLPVTRGEGLHEQVGLQGAGGEEIDIFPIAAAISSSVAALSAFNACGRFSVTTATGSSTS